MMKRAVYRSVWFWLGCFVLGFLVWAWVDSYKTGTCISRSWIIRSPGMEVRAIHTDEVRVIYGRIRIDWGRATITDPTLNLRYYPVSYQRDASPRWEGAAMPRWSGFVHDEGTGVRVVRDLVEVPMWGIVGLYLMGCCGVVVWWGRRRRRLGSVEQRVEGGIA